MSDSADSPPQTTSPYQGFGKLIPLPKSLNRNSFISALLLALIGTVSISKIEALKTQVMGGNTTEKNTSTSPTTNTSSRSKGQADATAFLKQVQGTMKERANTLAETHAADLAKNIASYLDEMEQSTKTIEQRVAREKNEERIKELIATSKSSQNQLPEKLTGRLALLPMYNKIHDKFIDQQKTINTTFESGMTDLSTVYISEINNQIGLYQSKKDQSAVQLLEREITLVAGNNDYFKKPIVPKGSSPTNK